MSLSRKGLTLSAVFFLWLSVLSLYFPLSSASTIYTYTDDAGTLTFTTGIGLDSEEISEPGHHT